MKNELRIFFTALMFYTRIPCPKWVNHDADYINKATRYFPLIGWLVGTISFLVFWLSSFLFDSSIAVLLSFVAGVLTTGAFHEDGFADVFDGFGGGWTKEKILDIMKDSRVGAYGVIALILLFALKYFALNQLAVTLKNHTNLILFLIFISYHALARLTAINIVFTANYSRADETSKAKPIAKAHTYKEILGAYVFGLTPLVTLSYFYWQFSLVIIPLVLIYFYAKQYFNNWIDGYTGDCLGALEQAAELLTLLSFLAIWKFM